MPHIFQQFYIAASCDARFHSRQNAACPLREHDRFDGRLSGGKPSAKAGLRFGLFGVLTVGWLLIGPLTLCDAARAQTLAPDTQATPVPAPQPKDSSSATEKPKRKPKKTSQQKAAKSETAESPETDAVLKTEGPFADHARQAGIRTCAATFVGLGKMLADGTKFATQTKWSQQEADRHSVQAIVGMSFASSSYNGPAAGIVFAAPTGKSCEGSMILVVPFQQSCQQAVIQLPGGSSPSITLEGNIAVFDFPNNGGQAVLLPAGTGCVVMSVVRVGGR
ncbi:MAG: hypothetical protein ACTHLK_22490 [Brucella intermedia]